MFWELVAPSATITRWSLLRSWVLILKELRNLFPSIMRFLLTTLLRGAMYEHLRVVPPGKRLCMPSCTRPEILGSG